jgi:hypothetical protein
MFIAHRSQIESSSFRSGMLYVYDIPLLKELDAGLMPSAINISLLRS